MLGYRLLPRIFCTVCCLAFLSLYAFVYIGGTSVNQNALSNYTQSDPADLVYHIDTYVDNQAGTTVTGWLLNKSEVYTFYNYGLNDDITGIYNNFKLCLKYDNNIYELPTKIIARPDIEIDELDGIRHERCGFVAFLPKGTPLNNPKVMALCKTLEGDEKLYDLNLLWGETGGEW